MRKAILGEVIFDVVEDEQVTDHAEVTSYTVEDGRSFSDHHAVLPSTMSIVGIFGAKGSDKKLSTLQRYLREAQLLTYTGRNIYTDMAIVSIDRNHTGDNKYGFAYTIELQHIPTQSAKRVNIKVTNPITKQKDNKTTKKAGGRGNKGRVQTSSVSNKKVQQKAIHTAEMYTPQRFVKTFNPKKDVTVSPM